MEINVTIRYCHICRLAITGIAFLIFGSHVFSQEMIGTQGLLNAPSADMQPAGTFQGGANFLQKRMMKDAFDYCTGLYYISFTPFSFVELTFRETLRKTRKSAYDDRVGYYQQDRSTTLRLRPFGEDADGWRPAMVVGINDIYSDHGGSEYACVYGVLTKHINMFGRLCVGLTAGYARPFDDGSVYDVVFGGMSLSLTSLPEVELCADYDTRGFNAGVRALFMRHLKVMCLTHDFKGISGGLSYL
ncbi:MAG: YjbH domain-containing protein, partial [Prevotella sp.]